MDHVLGLLHTLPPLAAYLVAALLVFGETGLILGLALPGEATLLLVGFLSYAGTLRLPVALAVMVLAALLGDTVAWVEGRRLGPKLRAGPLGRRVGEQRWARADELLNRHGGRAVALARFVAFVRTLTPRLAGISGLPYRRFLPWNVVGVVGWVSGSVLVGYLAGTSYERLAGLFGRATGALLLLVVVIVVLVLVGRYLGRHPEPVTDLGARIVCTRPLRWLRGRYAAAFRALIDRYGVAGATAVNLVLGVAVLLAIGTGLAWLSQRLVRQSGLPLVDPAIDSWLAGLRQPTAARAARITVTALRGSTVIAGVGAVGTLISWLESRRGRGGWGPVLGSVGMFLPLVILAVATELGLPSGAENVFPGQLTLVTAGFVILAWVISHQLPWTGAVAVWTLAVAGIVLATAARLYLRLSWPSEVAASVLLGALWALVFAVALHTRDRVARGRLRPGTAAARILAGTGRPGDGPGDRSGGSDRGAGGSGGPADGSGGPGNGSSSRAADHAREPDRDRSGNRG